MCRLSGRIAAALVLVLAPAAFGLAEERQIQVSAGESLRIVEVGHGQPVVLVPGLLGSAFSFRNLIAPLAARGHRVIVIEPLGVGGSSTPPAADYSLTAQADRLDTVLRMLDADEAVIVAHGVGASMALRLAYRHAERVKAIVSIDGGPAEAAATPGFRRAMRLSWLIKVFGGLGRIRRAVRSTLIERSVDSTWVTEDVVEGYMAAAARDLDGTLRAFRQIAKAGEPQLLAPHLVEVRCPVRLVIGDDRTRGISDAEIQLLSTQLGAFSIDRVEHTGHFLYEEEPLAVVTAVERALAETRPEDRLAARRP